ncbi:hypothetical protein G6F57_017201 [Rhizopus arrhizus]|nr:hypothetical protein G6F57_017201 [Rhizopus arrhizus]
MAGARARSEPAGIGAAGTLGPCGQAGIHGAARAGQEAAAGAGRCRDAGQLVPRLGLGLHRPAQQHHQLQVRMGRQPERDLLEGQLAVPGVLEFTQAPLALHHGVARPPMGEHGALAA